VRDPSGVSPPRNSPPHPTSPRLYKAAPLLSYETELPTRTKRQHRAYTDAGFVCGTAYSLSVAGAITDCTFYAQHMRILSADRHTTSICYSSEDFSIEGAGTLYNKTAWKIDQRLNSRRIASTHSRTIIPMNFQFWPHADQDVVDLLPRDHWFSMNYHRLL
jgi:hypothetical protein